MGSRVPPLVLIVDSGHGEMDGGWGNREVIMVSNEQRGSKGPMICYGEQKSVERYK